MAKPLLAALTLTALLLLGLTAADAQTNPQPDNTQIAAAADKYIALSAGHSHTCRLRDTGALTC